ncbi:RGCVC family protein [Allokutzneria sp. NRRL B-24872]|uniref:RGCVC family protein n=1 Tax=Allokutzneria sp. NRRL B-24872 TaxID=1137961 RepID=UPI00143CF77C|nr:RGCVC family protein [Allokutzneria sp. NRRL B-24872]
MPGTELHTAVLDNRADAADICAACPHPWHEHDPIGVRYCTATTASVLPRGCICR